MKFDILTSKTDIALLGTAMEIIDYTPETVTGDKYYKVLSKSSVYDACRHNRQLLNAINNRKHLSVEDYKETLNAVGFTILDYCRFKVAPSYEKFVSDCIDNGYSFEYSKVDMFSFIMGESETEYYWYLYSKDSDISIRSYKLYSSDRYKGFTGKSGNVSLGDSRCVQIGLCKFFISKTDKKVYCRSVKKEFISIKREDNLIKGVLSQ